MPAGWLHEPEAADVLHERAPPAGDGGLAVGGRQRIPGAGAETRLLSEQDPHGGSQNPETADLLQVYGRTQPVGTDCVGLSG